MDLLRRSRSILVTPGDIGVVQLPSWSEAKKIHPIVVDAVEERGSGSDPVYELSRRIETDSIDIVGRSSGVGHKRTIGAIQVRTNNSARPASGVLTRHESIRAIYLDSLWIRKSRNENLTIRSVGIDTLDYSRARICEEDDVECACVERERGYH